MTVAVGPDIEGLTFLQHLGSGGYSDVYLYQRERPKMRVAVKVLTGSRLTPAEMAQFAAEAEIMAVLADHPYIVQVFWTGMTREGRPYLVMKYYPPPNLGKRSEDQRLGLAEVLRTGIQVGSAVETAHRAGILHRDIKPANILVSSYNAPGLTDFGIAGRTAEPTDTEDLGVSIPWSAPEVLSGASNGTAASDVYSLAASIWHLLVGRSPFEVRGGDNSPRAIMGRVLRTAPPPTGRADVPPSLDRLLQQAMAKSIQQRPRTALEFSRGLQSIEQELRFARTEIVVEELGTAAPSVSEVSPDPTRMRAFRPGSPESAPSAPAPAHLAQDPPARASAPPATQDAEPATVLRAARPTDLAPNLAPPQRRARWRTSYVVAAVVAAAVGIIVVAVTAFGRGSDSPASPPPSQNKATDQAGFSPDANAQAPTVVASYDARTEALTFTWKTSASMPRDFVYWLYTPSTSDPAEHRTSATQYVARTSDPAATCIVVASVTSGGTLIRGGQVCGTR